MDESVAETVGEPPAVRGRSFADWQKVRVAYEETKETVVSICARFETNKSALRDAIICYGWRRRSPRVIDRHDVIERLFRVLDKQIRALEKNLSKAGQGEVAAVLGRMVSTLDKLIAIKDAQTARRNPAQSTRRISDIKAKLIERIEQLKRR